MKASLTDEVYVRLSGTDTSPVKNLSLIHIYNHTGTNYDAYVVDHFSDAGVNVMQKYYENNLFSDPETAELIKEVGGNWFEDSLEMTTAGLWTYDILEEFQEETGYDLTNYLPFVLKVTGMDSISNNSPFILTDDTDNLVTNVRNDYVETLSNLYNYERTQDMVDWAETYGMGYLSLIHILSITYQ